MSRKQRQLSFNSRISLFLVLLIIMCLVSFASLSLTSAMADLRLSDKYEEQVIRYYSARNEAQKDLARLNTSAGPLSDADSRGMITRHYPAGDTQQLTVVFAPSSSRDSDAEQKKDPEFRVISEKLESTVEYDLDESLHLMKE